MHIGNNKYKRKHLDILQRSTAAFAVIVIMKKSDSFTLSDLAPPARLELTTLRLGGARSILVSYGGITGLF